MTINLANNNPRIEYSVAEGVTQQTFAVPFEFFDDGDLSVYVDGVLKAEGTDYTTTGGDGSTGTVVFVTAVPPAVQQVTGAVGGSQVVIVRNIPIERTSDFSAGSDINRAALNEQLDILTAMLADLKSKIDRSVTLAEYDVVNYQLAIPPTAQRLNKYLAFGSTGNLTVTSGTTSSLIVSAFGETLIDDLDAAEALQTLGLTATASELNVLDGVTASTAELNILDGVTASTAELNILDGITATTAEINILDGVTATTAEINHVVGTTSAIQTQLDAKYDSGDLASQAEAEAGTDNTKLMTPLLVKNALNATGSAPTYACRAWVNFNGTGTVAIRASGNVSSITDNGTGDYTVNFTTAMPDANYAACGIGSNNFSGFPPDYDIVSMAAGSLRFQTKATGSTVAFQDPVFTTLAIFR